MRPDARPLLSGAALLVLAACGGQSPPPPRHARAQIDVAPEGSARTVLRPLEGHCEPDRSPLDVPEGGFATEGAVEGGNAVWRIARLTSRGVLGARCTRAVFGGETALEVDAMEATMGGAPMIVAVDTAHCRATCPADSEEAECESEVVSAWVLDADLRLIGGVVDEAGGPVSVDNGVLVLGTERRTVRDGALVSAPAEGRSATP